MDELTVEAAVVADFSEWLELAREVEPMFGPMAEDDGFKAALLQVIENGEGFRLRSADGFFQGAIAICRDLNSIEWLAVAKQGRGCGCGRKLLERALAELAHDRPIVVQTFAKSVEEGAAARNLYERFGFWEEEDGGLNPAGVATVMMRKRC